MLCDAVRYAKVTGQTQIREEVLIDEINKTKPIVKADSSIISRENSNKSETDCIDEDGFRYVKYDFNIVDGIFCT